MRLAVLVSGGGSNLQAIIDAIENGFLSEIEIALVIADRTCHGLTRAKVIGIETMQFDRSGNLSEKVDIACKEHDVDLIVLAGFLSILNADFCVEWDKRIINLHPSLLPKYGGKGMYGDKVHRSVLENNEIESGATVHYVTAGVDEGEIILQKRFSIPSDSDIGWIKQKINEIEKPLLIQAIKKIATEN